MSCIPNTHRYYQYIFRQEDIFNFWERILANILQRNCRAHVRETEMSKENTRGGSEARGKPYNLK